MSLELSAVSAKRLRYMTLRLEPGLHVVIGAPHDGSLELLQLAAGVFEPAKGSVRIRGANPFRHPETRRHIGSALADPRFEEISIEAAMERRFALRGLNVAARGVLSRFGLDHLAAQHPARLSERERQAVALVIALSLERPRLLVLHEPDLQSLLPVERVLETLSQHAKEAVVLCATASPRTAALLGPDALVLEDGRLLREVRAPTRPAFMTSGPARIRVESDASALLARSLSHHPAVSGIHWEAGSDVLFVEGPETEALCLLVVASATQHGITIRQLSQSLPEPTELRATHAALARAAFDRAYATTTHTHANTITPAGPEHSPAKHPGEAPR